ncbi:MAG: hypothetical protein KDB65_00220 [Calditrichaeota bacterium]|nr:hypothetical protein [Calditrichota bacterium]MCB9368549.1 hypothetical protein [Calditrichota bacterium]
MRNVLAVVVSGVWIILSEFVRNEFFFKSKWMDHYAKLGLSFETLPINGILWTLWSFGQAYLIFRLLKKFSFVETICLTWLVCFVMMWFVLYNLQVLPTGLLVFAVPLSLLEVLVAAWIVRKVAV